MKTSQTPTVAPLYLGPAPRFRLVGRSLQFGPRNDEIARYREGRWHSGDGEFAVLESESPTLLHFEGGDLEQTEVRGPFPALQVTNGTIRWGSAAYQVLATFDEDTGSWQMHPDGCRFEMVVLTPAPEDAEEDSISADDFLRTDQSISRPSVRGGQRASQRPSFNVAW